MVDIQTGRPDPEHTRNPVPCIIASADNRFIPNPAIPVDHILELKEVAPTMLDILGLPNGAEMTGLPLVKLK
jgi:bisphosphoglycerate-independent phosphoglycerate mutase (AlkP superfamily)